MMRKNNNNYMLMVMISLDLKTLYDISIFMKIAYLSFFFLIYIGEIITYIVRNVKVDE